MDWPLCIFRIENYPWRGFLRSISGNLHTAGCSIGLVCTYFSTPIIAAFYAWAAQSDFYFQFWTRVNWAQLWGFEPIKVQTAYCFLIRNIQECMILKILPFNLIFWKLREIEFFLMIMSRVDYVNREPSNLAHLFNATVQQ